MRERSKELNESPVEFLNILQERSGRRFSADSRVLLAGANSMVIGLEYARRLLREGKADCCVIGGVDSLLDQITLQGLELSRRLKKPINPDGVIPGEAACFTSWAVRRPDHRPVTLQLHGVGTCENLAESGAGDLPGTALTAAMRAAFAEAGVPNGTLSWEITDLTGERELFVEHAVAVTRVFTDPQPRLQVWHQAMSLGTIGAASGAGAMAWAATAVVKGYAPGRNVLCVASSDFERKSALIVGAVPEG